MASGEWVDSKAKRDWRAFAIDDQHGWGLALLTLVTCALFIRPGELIPLTAGLPVYQVLIAACLFVSARALWTQLFCLRFSDRPVTACLLLLWMSVGISHLVNGSLWGARDSLWEVSKQIAFYVLIVGLVNTPSRLRYYVGMLSLLITTVAALALMDHLNWIQLNAIETLHEMHRTGEATEGTIARIRGTGIFEDPNDLGLVIVLGMVLNAFFMTEADLGWPRYLWAIPMIVLGITLSETHSRGALLSLAAAIPAWFFYHRGIGNAIVGTCMVIPIVFFLFSGRMTEVDAVFDGTGQSRLQIWSDAFSVFRTSPVFGIGEGMFAEEYGYVAHNSFLQAFAELGAVGGSAFVAVFASASVGLIARVRQDVDRETNRLRGFVFAALVGYSVGIFTLSRQFVGPTFLVLGLAASTQAISNCNLGSGWKIGVEFALRILFASALFLLGIYLLIRILVNR